MKVVEKPNKEKAGKDVDDASFMLTNRDGGYVAMSNEPRSRFEGVFFRLEKDFFKAIESIRINRPVTKITNELWKVSRERGTLKEEFFMPLNHNALAYELSEKEEFELLLDFKKSYDDREWGRKYEIDKESKCIIIKFSKENEEKEPKGDEYSFCMAICSSDMEYQPMSCWEKRFYPLDEQRSSKPYERYIFNACKIRSNKVVFAAAINKNTAIKEAKYTLRNLERLKREKEKHVSSVIHKKHIKNEELSVAYQCAMNALDSLVIGDEGVMAGLPWFFQFWARDELISAKGLMEIGEYALVKKMLFRHLDMISHDASLLNRFPDPDLKSADAIGWLFKRFEDFIEILQHKGLLKKYISRKEMEHLVDRLNIILSTIIKYKTKEGLVISGKNETWMDTSFESDSREGALIEIQALTLAMFRLLRKIGKEDLYETELKAAVRADMFNKKILADGLDNFIIRPNVFIAAYVYPELLTKKEWNTVFDSMLPKLWLKWGGLSTIDKSHPLYLSAHTGQDLRSYHRGDSWFWINNLAAIVLYRLDRKKYWKYISKIIAASVQEMLYMGYTGYSSEVSSATELKSEGCWGQAWSSAMFIELIGEIYG